MAARVALLALGLVVLGGAPSAGAENRLFVAAGKGGQAAFGPYAGPATDAGLFGLRGDIAVMPDGSFLAPVWTDDDSLIVRVDPKGRIARVAGGADGFSGDGGPASRSRLRAPADVAVTRDGGFLIADKDNCRVRRVGPDGIINTVAGSGPANCLAQEPPNTAGRAPGDGGPATAARVNPRAVAALRDGGFLLSEGNRVRRVRPDGRITTVAGTGVNPLTFTTPGKLATATEISEPGRLAEAPDGGFLVQDGFGSVLRVRPDGIIVASAGNGALCPPSCRVTLSDTGAMYAFTGPHPRIIGPLPAADTLVAGNRSGYFLGWGEPATRAPSGVTDAHDIEPTRDGGLLLATRNQQVVLSASPATSRLAVSVARESLSALLRRRLRFRLTRAARVRVRLYRGRRVAARLSVRGRRGLNTVRLPRSSARGLYYARLRAQSSDGAVATNGLRVLVGPWLPKDVAVRAIKLGWSGASTADEPPPETTIKGCRRFGPRRIDCVAGQVDVDTSTPCAAVVSAVLRRSGYLYLRNYRCRKRKRARRVGQLRVRPRYTGRAYQAPAL